MKRFLNVFCIFVLTLSLISGCSSFKKEEKGTASSANQEVAKASAEYDRSLKDAANGGGNAGEGGPAPKESADSVASVAGTGTSSGQTVSNAILAQRKIIRNANISVEVEDFEKAYGQIKSMISAFGYIQESNIRKEKIYIASKEKLITKGIIIIRVEKDKFESILTDVKGLGLLMDENIKSDDVTDKFFDTESRLRLLKYEESRLEQYLLKITDPDVIFKTESRLTDIRHEIEGLTGTLKKWSDLVELSTITINLSEKIPGAGEAQKDQSYLNRLSGSFMDTIEGIAYFGGSFLIFLVKAVPILIIFILTAFLLVKVYKKFFKKIMKLVKKDADVK